MDPGEKFLFWLPSGTYGLLCRRFGVLIVFGSSSKFGSGFEVLSKMAVVDSIVVRADVKFKSFRFVQI